MSSRCGCFTETRTEVQTKLEGNYGCKVRICGMVRAPWDNSSDGIARLLGKRHPCNSASCATATRPCSRTTAGCTTSRTSCACLKRLVRAGRLNQGEQGHTRLIASVLLCSGATSWQRASGRCSSLTWRWTPYSAATLRPPTVTLRSCPRSWYRAMSVASARPSRHHTCPR